MGKRRDKKYIALKIYGWETLNVKAHMHDDGSIVLFDLKKDAQNFAHELMRDNKILRDVQVLVIDLSLKKLNALCNHVFKNKSKTSSIWICTRCGVSLPKH